MFDDPNWISKYLIGILISIVPVLNIAWFGYGIGIMRNMARGVEKPLPSWDNIGEKFKDGLFVAIASFVYALPAVVVILASTFAFVIPAFSENRDVQQGLAAMVGGGFILSCCCIGLYLLAFSFFYPAMMIHYARVGSLGSLFQAGEIIKLATKNMGEYLMAWLSGILAGAIFGTIAPVLVLMCCVPAFLGTAWVMSVTHYAYGQVGLSLTSPSAE
jgi:hypothetical protein